MNNDSIAEREGRELERAAIVNSVEGLAAAIERCAHRSGS